MTAFFAGVDGVYRTDGTAGGTARIADPGLDPFSFTGLGRLGPAYLFTAGPAGAPSDEADLWRTDGTASGTQRLTANLDLSFPFVSAANGGTMLIGNGPGLWATDGTAAGSRKLFSDQPTRFGGDAFPVDDGFLAGVDDPVDGHQLWHLDPAGSNPRLMKTFAPGLAGRYPRSFGQVGTRVLFSTQDGPGSWQWHALELATGQVEPLSGLRGRPELDPPVTVGGVTYLTTYESTGTMLYRTDGTSAGTTLLHRFEGEFSDVPHAFTGYGGVTWFVAEDDEHGTELWRTDGTVEGTRLERDFIPGWLSSYPRDLVATDDFLFFVVDDPEYGTEPWRIRMPAVTRPGEAEPAPEPEPTLAPLPAPVTPIVSPTTPKPAPPRFGSPKLRPSVAVRSQRLRAGGGKARWRVAGSVAETSCFGRVRISLGRGDRTVTRVSTPLRRCRFSAVVTAGRRTAVRWVQVRTVPSPLLDAATSRRRPIA
jgi:ELWxxDGT repeat protein